MKDTTHGLMESKSEEFSKILHEIAELEKIRSKYSLFQIIYAQENMLDYDNE
jgi:hypothetical protein